MAVDTMASDEWLGGEEKTSVRAFPWAIVFVIAIPYVILLLIGLLAPPFPNASFGAVSGWLSAGLFSRGVLSAGVFSIGFSRLGYSRSVFSPSAASLSGSGWLAVSSEDVSGGR